MMAFWLERFVELGEGTRILFPFKNSMVVRQLALRYSSSWGVVRGHAHDSFD
jgi:hypothetical protein